MVRLSSLYGGLRKASRLLATQQALGPSETTLPKQISPSPGVTATSCRVTTSQHILVRQVDLDTGLNSCRAMTAAVASRANSGDQASLAKVLYAVEAAPSHYWQGNQEGPRRVEAITKELQTWNITPASLRTQLECIGDLQPASEQQIQRVHDPQYIEWLRTAVQDAPKVIADPEVPEEVTYVTSTSYTDALKAAGAAIRMVDEVVHASNRSRSNRAGPACPVGFAIVRPPGHHAGVETPSGFCLFNNVAIAARHAQQQHGLERVLIFDFDVHCGNGTIDIFCEDPSVLVVDMHERDVWPHTGHIDQVGHSKGQGFTVDIPMPVQSGHTAAGAVFDRVVQPAAQRFRPDLILVSAGYDAHWRDPLAQLNFQSATYHLLACKLKALADQLCDGRLVFLLEGGYSSEGLASSVAESFLGLLGRPPVHPLDSNVPAEPDAEVEQLIQDLKKLHDL